MYQSKKGKQVKVNSETSNAGGSSKIPNPKVVNRSGNGNTSGSERQIDAITTGKRSKYPDTHIDVTKSLSSTSGSSRSSSLSDSSSDDFFPIDELKLIAPDAAALAVASKSKQKNVSSIESSSKSEVDNRPPLPISTYQVSTPTYKQKGGTLPIMSPPMQVMDRSGRYDPSRIPASIFERNGNPLDWSIASNESLFSLHIGQSSFSRDTFKFPELTTSGELNKSDEFNTFNRIPSVTIEEIDIARESVDVEVENLPTTETSVEPSKLEQKICEDQNKIKTLHQADSCKSSLHQAESYKSALHQADSYKSSLHQAESYKLALHQAESCKSSSKTSASSVSVSHEGITAAHTFVPLKKRSRPFCFCCNCSWALCYPKWPNLGNTRSNCCHTCSNCCFGWPSCHTCSHCCFGWPTCKCSCCGLVLCCCCNCCHTKSSGHASPILTERDSEGSSNLFASCWYCCRSKPASEPKSSCSCWSCHWFRCFSCPSCTFKVSCTRWKCCFSCTRWKCCC